MDRRLAADRRHPGGSKKTHLEDVGTLPAGAFVLQGGDAWLLHEGRLRRWTPGGYDRSEPIGTGTIEVLTPHATTEVLRRGYVPGVHASAGDDVGRAESP